MFVLYVLHKKFQNFINIVMRHDCRDNVSKVWSWSENVYREYKIFTVAIYLTKN